jgi:hypothetical protein
MLKCGFLNTQHILMVWLEGEIVITNRPYDTLYLLRAETHLNEVCTGNVIFSCTNATPVFDEKEDCYLK